MDDAKLFQDTYLMQDLYVESTENSCTPVRKTENSGKQAKDRDQVLHKRGYPNSLDSHEKMLGLLVIRKCSVNPERDSTTHLPE